MWVRNGEWDSFSKQRDDSIKLCSVESSNNWRYRSDSSYRNYYFKQGPMGHYIDPHQKNGKSILISESNNLCASKYQKNLSIESFDLLGTDSKLSFCFAPIALIHQTECVFSSSQLPLPLSHENKTSTTLKVQWNLIIFFSLIASIVAVVTVYIVDVVIVSVVVCVAVAVAVIVAVPLFLCLWLWTFQDVSRCPVSVFLLLFPLFSLRDDRCWDFLLRSENEEGLKGICFN